jgi:uncharacterized membrane protein
MNRHCKLLITLSMLLNLLLAGIIAGHAGRGLMPPPPRGMQDMSEALPEARRAVFKDAMQRAEEDTAELHEQINEARNKAALILKAETFDKDAYMAEVQLMSKLRAQTMQRMAEAVVEVAEQSDATERATLADMVRRPQHPARTPQ